MPAFYPPSLNQQRPEPTMYMPRMDRVSYKEIANARIGARIKQMVVLILTIVIGILISVSVNG
jgi:hypothetical protein